MPDSQGQFQPNGQGTVVPGEYQYNGNPGSQQNTPMIEPAFGSASSVQPQPALEQGQATQPSQQQVHNAVAGGAQPQTTNGAIQGAQIAFIVGPTSYLIAPASNQQDPGDITAFHPLQGYWSLNNLPVILGQLFPDATWSQAKKVPTLVENGQPVISPVTKRTLRNLPHLPRQICSQIEGWRLEAWIRLDGRIEYNDIQDRMSVRNPPNTNQLQMRRYRFREENFMMSWTARRSAICRAEIFAIEKLSMAQISRNTTWSIQPNGTLLQPVNPRNVPGSPQGVSMGPFPIAVWFQPMNAHARARLQAAQAELLRLRTQAAVEGVTDWRELSPQYFSGSWKDRQKKDAGVAQQQPVRASRKRKAPAGPNQDASSGSNNEHSQRPIKRARTTDPNVNNQTTSTSRSGSYQRLARASSRFSASRRIRETARGGDQGIRNKDGGRIDQNVEGSGEQTTSVEPSPQTNTRRENDASDQVTNDINALIAQDFEMFDNMGTESAGIVASVDPGQGTATQDIPVNPNSSNEEKEVQDYDLELSKTENPLSYRDWFRQHGQAEYERWRTTAVGDRSYSRWVTWEAGKSYPTYFYETRRTQALSQRAARRTTEEARTRQHNERLDAETAEFQKQLDALSQLPEEPQRTSNDREQIRQSDSDSLALDLERAFMEDHATQSNGIRVETKDPPPEESHHEMTATTSEIPESDQSPPATAQLGKEDFDEDLFGDESGLDEILGVQDLEGSGLLTSEEQRLHETLTIAITQMQETPATATTGGGDLSAQLTRSLSGGPMEYLTHSVSSRSEPPVEEGVPSASVLGPPTPPRVATPRWPDVRSEIGRPLAEPTPAPNPPRPRYAASSDFIQQQLQFREEQDEAERRAQPSRR
ncbi:MAG: hypothetical protein M1833_000095 [Piccolia ochrophora]|nr:MAG: hypothetical protein M1833_000095 [Piccolia ochrophora]